ncbi:MAG: carbohydrate ABC transporter permease [Anaerolineae bacterium]
MVETSQSQTKRAPARRAQFMEEAGRVLRRPQFWFGVAWIVPTIIWYYFFSFGPILRAFPIAAVRYNILDPGSSPFVGFGNFQALFNMPLFPIVVRNTITWAILAFSMMLPTAMVLSLCLANVRRGRNLYQALVFIPVVVSLVAISLLFRMLLDPDVGQVNRILRMVGLPESKFLTGSNTALPTSVVIGTWKGVGFHVVILTAGLMGIPEELYDAARVDGVNEWQRFWHVTLPLLGNTLLLITVMLAIGSLQEFGLPFVMTSGGPGDATRLYNLLIYNEAFQSLRFGTASAAALMQFVVILVVSIAQIKLLRPNWSY